MREDSKSGLKEGQNLYRLVTLCTSCRRGAELSLEASRAVGSPGAEFWVSSMENSAMMWKDGREDWLDREPWSVVMFSPYCSLIYRIA